MTMQIDVAELAGIIAEGALFGIAVVFLLASLHILTIGRMKSSSANIPMAVVSGLMLAVATAQLIVDSMNIFRAFITIDNRLERIAYMRNATEPLFATRHALYFCQMLIGDGIVIWRAYLVWRRNFWIVLFPILCALGSGACAWQTIWATQHIAEVSIEGQVNFGFAIFSLSIAANGIATGLIVYRIWSHERRMHSTSSRLTIRSSRNLVPVLLVVIESGALNAAYLLAYISVYASHSNGLEIMASISTPLVGIIFSMVIIRAGIAQQREQTTATHGSGSSVPLPHLNRSGISGGRTVVEITSQVTEWNDHDHKPDTQAFGKPDRPF